MVINCAASRSACSVAELYRYRQQVFRGRRSSGMKSDSIDSMAVDIIEVRQCICCSKCAAKTKARANMISIGNDLPKVILNAPEVAS